MHHLAQLHRDEYLSPSDGFLLPKLVDLQSD
jgi:hypothetical protein